MAGLRETVIGALRFAAAELGPLLVFWGVNWFWGLKAAIAASIVSMVVDGIWRLWRRLPFSPVYLLTSALVLVFGGIDLWADSPFMLKYEAVVINVVTGIIFTVGVLGDQPLLQVLAEQRQGEEYGNRPDIRRFFQLLTLFWAAYFFIKAAFYLVIGQMMPLPEAMAVRSVVGTVSLGVMVLISLQGRRLFRFCKWLGLLPAEPPMHETKA